LKGMRLHVEEALVQPLRLSRGLRSVSGDRLGLRLARRRASSRFSVARVTCCGPRLDSIGWLTKSISPFSCAGAGSDDASPVLASSLRRHTSSRHIACASMSLTRDRPLTPKQSADVGHYGRTRHDRPGPRLLGRIRHLSRGLLPLQRTSAASRLARKAAGPADVPASALLASPARAPPGQSPARTSVTAAQVALAVFHTLFDGPRSGTARTADGRGGSFDRRQRAPRACLRHVRATHSSIEKTRLPSSSIRRTGGVGVTDAAHASRRIRPIERYHGAIRRPSRVMHRRVL
jgi:hypothetical protein